MNQSVEMKIYEAYKRNPALSKEELYDVINKVIRIKKFGDGKKFVPFSPLFIEVAMGNQKAVLDLIKNGADVNEVNEDGLTPLGVAVLVNDFFMALELLDNGADVNGTIQFNPLLIASSRCDARMMELLFRYGADPAVVDSKGFNAFHHLFNNGTIGSLKPPYCDYLYFRYFPYETSVYNTNIRPEDVAHCVEVLSKNGVDVNYTNTVSVLRGDKKFVIPVNPLSLALESQQMRVIDSLAECGAEMRAYEIMPSRVYEYQDSFNFFDDIREKDLSLWPDAPFEYFRYLEYRRRINAHKIEVISVFDNDTYKRPRVIKRVNSMYKPEQ